MVELNAIENIKDPGQRMAILSALISIANPAHQAYLPVLRLASDCAYQLKNYKQSLAYAHDLKMIFPDEPDGYWRTVRALLDLENLHDAVEVAEKGLGKFYNDINVLTYCRFACIINRNYEDALSISRSLQELYSFSGFSHVLVAEDLVLLQKIDEATSEFALAVQKSPRDQLVLKSAIEFYSKYGTRKQALDLSNQLLSSNPSVWHGHFAKIVQLIILGRANDAVRALEVAKPLFAKPNQIIMLDRLHRYLHPDGLDTLAARSMHLTRDKLIKTFYHDPGLFSGLPFHEYSDFVLIANNPSIVFDNKDLSIIKSMKRPLFVYLNNGNKAIMDIRQSFYPSSFGEILIGRARYSATPSGELLFRAYDPASFLGFLLVIDHKPSWLHHFTEINPGVKLYNIHTIRDAIKSCYPESNFFEKGLQKRRVPSIGWLALSLFDALAVFFSSDDSTAANGFAGNSYKLWCAGFTLSPSYLFEVVKKDIHDHVMEKIALDMRFKHGIALTLGRASYL
jgi:tetratricopeptide (TPR) repeat protein